MSIHGADTARHVEIDATDLPLYCPTAAAPLWARHPRVYLDVAKAGEVQCPYCGTKFVYKGPPPTGH